MLEILYRTDEILVVNKPFGMSCQGGESSGVPLDKVLSKQLGVKRVYLVHRLDRDTSGLMVVALTSEAAGKWTRIIGGHHVRKEYQAICIGAPKTPLGTITLPVTGKSAITEYEVIGTATSHKLSLIRCRLLTGRTHQIRIHLASIGCPIVLDDKHGNFALNRALRKTYAVRRLCLASVRLTLPDRTVVVAPLPPHMMELIRTARVSIIVP